MKLLIMWTIFVYNNMKKNYSKYNYKFFLYIIPLFLIQGGEDYETLYIPDFCLIHWCSFKKYKVRRFFDGEEQGFIFIHRSWKPFHLPFFAHQTSFFVHSVFFAFSSPFPFFLFPSLYLFFFPFSLFLTSPRKNLSRNYYKPWICKDIKKRRLVRNKSHKWVE